MAIGSIGQNGGAPQIGAAPTPVSGPDGEKFELLAKGIEPPNRTALIAPVPRGEVRLDVYLNARLTEAMGHLEGKLSRDQLDFVKDEIREQLGSDPVLIELVQKATGRAPESRAI